MDPRRLHNAILLASLGAALGLATCGLAVQVGGNRAEELTLAAIGLQTFLALSAFAGATLSRGPVWERLGLAPGRLGVGWLALLVLGVLGLSLALDGILELTGLRAHSALSEFEAQLTGIRGRTLLLALLGIGLAPGVAEELLCRGLLQRGLERPLGAPAAIAVSACLFGMLHFEAVHGALAAVLGLYLGSAAYLTGSVRTSIACHVANNAAAVGLAAWNPQEMPPAPTTTAVGLLLAAGCLWAVWSRAGPTTPGAPSPCNAHTWEEGSHAGGPPGKRGPRPPRALTGAGEAGSGGSGLQPGAGTDDP